MIDLFRQLLEEVLFPEDETGGLVLVAEPEPRIDQGRGVTSIYCVPHELFPQGCQVRTLQGGEAFIESLKQVVSEIHPSRLFLIPPFLAPRRMSRKLRAEFPWLDLGEIALQVAVENLECGSIVGSILPINFFAGEAPRAFRERLFQETTPRLIIMHDHFWQLLGFNVHSLVTVSALLLEKGRQQSRILRFFKCPEVITEQQKTEVVSDFRRLLRQGGGQTRYGYVLRDGLFPGAALLYDKYHPDFVQRQEDMAYFGSIQSLEDLVDVVKGLHRARDSDSLFEGSSGTRVPVIEGRDIRPDGSLGGPPLWCWWT